MSLRLLQKQTGQDASTTGGNNSRGGRGSGRGWGYKKSATAPLGRSSTAEPSEADNDGNWRDAATSRYTPKGKGGGRGGKGLGRGSSSDFLSGFGVQEEDTAQESTENVGAEPAPPKPAARTQTAPPVTSAQDAAGDDATGVEAVVGLADVLRESSLLASHGAKAAAWCDQEGAANLEEIAEVLDEFAKGMSLKPLQKKRFEKALQAALGADASESPAVASESTPSNAPTTSQELSDEKRQEQEEMDRAAARQEEERQSEQRRREASQALEAAIAGADAQRLQTALDHAESCGVEGSQAEAARARLVELEQAESQRREEEAAVDDLSTAMRAEDISAIREAIERAEVVGVGEEAIQPAKQAMHKLAEKSQRDEAAAKLQAVIDAEDVDVLQAEIAAAEQAGVPQNHVQKAKARLAELEAAEEQRRQEEQRQDEIAEATKALKAACEGSDLFALEEAMANASAVGVPEDAPVMAQAHTVSAELAEQAFQEREREKAMDVVVAAMEARDVDALRCAIAAAQTAGVAPGELADANKELTALETNAAQANDEAASAVDDLRAAVSARDAVTLAAAIAKAEKAGVDKEEIAGAKRVAFQLQKEQRELKKKMKEKKDALGALEAAMETDDAQAVRDAITKAEQVGADDSELASAREKLAALEEGEKLEAARLALEDFEFAFGQNDVESATLALEEAAAEGASPEDLSEAEQRLAALREKLDPEGEARRKRIEARRQKEAEAGIKKWNFSGKSKNQPVNDRLREHEAELEARRVLAFRGRGRFKNNAEDEGEDAAEKEVKKQRAEVIKERGAVPTAPVEPQRGFTWGRSPKEETEAPRQLTLRAHREMGAGMDLHASWWGMFVDAIDDEPGQPGLRLRDTITSVNGTTLCELEADDCEQRFADLFGDGSVVSVEPYVELVGFLTAASTVDKSSLQADLERFAADWGVELSTSEAGTGGANLRIAMEGSQSAIKASKTEIEQLMSYYAGS